MKIRISYFYRVRDFEPHILCLSTAMWDPKWFHDFKEKDHVFIDKNGVLNGLRAEMLLFPMHKWNDLKEQNCECIRDCSLTDRVKAQMETNERFGLDETFGCKFMDAYFDHLYNNVDFEDFMRWLNALAAKHKELLKYKEETEVVLLVHEPPYRKCAERPVLQKWFDNFYQTLDEWEPDN